MLRPLLALALLSSLLLSSALAADADQPVRKPFGLEKRVPWTTSNMVGYPEPPPPYRPERVFPKLSFSEPLDLAAQPGGKRLWVAERRGNYVPDVSFGTHFFQDLVEAGIRYLPLFPGQPDVTFNSRFLHEAPNALGELLPEYASLASAVRVIDVPRATGGLVLRVLMNADTEQALGMLASPRDPIA